MEPTWLGRDQDEREARRMKLTLLTPRSWMHLQKKLISYAVRFGDKRLTLAAIHSLRKLDGIMLEADSDQRYSAVVAVVKLGERIAGFGFAQGGGNTENGSHADSSDTCCIVVVHPDSRRLGVGSAIMKAMMERLGGLTCNVAIDNTASMALCFGLGMTAVSMHQGPTGKSTLRFERRIEHDTARSRHSDTIPQ